MSRLQRRRLRALLTRRPGRVPKWLCDRLLAGDPVVEGYADWIIANP